ncbi:MAG: FHA domain-containing protein [Desulfatitalea sp.]|nr:FHA domain-containing protein [Desulfatitalea sp.]NNK01934.1 FHA domain-containing protein [Desulfatitalea sp.]
MATMENLLTGEKVFLKSHHVFGRSRDKADTELENRDISQIHAAILWNGWEWLLTDFSRNGIWIDGARLDRGKNTALKKGDVIRFSSTGESAWTLSDLKPPANMLIPVQNQAPVIELDRLRALPDDATPDILVYLSHTGQWVYEHQDVTTPLSNGDMIHHQSGSWRFFRAEPVATTLSREIDGDIRFVFHVSTDEEHVEIKVLLGANTIDLGERAHHYMLLTLARQRLNDARQGDDQATQGWIEADWMAEMLNLEPNHLNIHIYRIRKQVKASVPKTFNLSRLVERRVGGLRFGYPDFQILRGASVEGTLCKGKIA